VYANPVRPHKIYGQRMETTLQGALRVVDRQRVEGIRSRTSTVPAGTSYSRVMRAPSFSHGRHHGQGFKRVRAILLGGLQASTRKNARRTLTNFRCGHGPRTGWRFGACAPMARACHLLGCASRGAGRGPNWTAYAINRHFVHSKRPPSTIQGDKTWRTWRMPTKTSARSLRSAR
jgi:hypothetical protein